MKVPTVVGRTPAGRVGGDKADAPVTRGQPTRLTVAERATQQALRKEAIDGAPIQASLDAGRNQNHGVHQPSSLLGLRLNKSGSGKPLEALSRAFGQLLHGGTKAVGAAALGVLLATATPASASQASAPTPTSAVQVEQVAASQLTRQANGLANWLISGEGDDAQRIRAYQALPGIRADIAAGNLSAAQRAMREVSPVGSRLEAAPRVNGDLTAVGTQLAAQLNAELDALEDQLLAAKDYDGRIACTELLGKARTALANDDLVTARDNISEAVRQSPDAYDRGEKILIALSIMLALGSIFRFAAGPPNEDMD